MRPNSLSAISPRCPDTLLAARSTGGTSGETAGGVIIKALLETG